MGVEAGRIQGPDRMASQRGEVGRRRHGGRYEAVAGAVVGSGRADEGVRRLGLMMMLRQDLLRLELVGIVEGGGEKLQLT